MRSMPPVPRFLRLDPRLSWAIPICGFFVLVLRHWDSLVYPQFIYEDAGAFWAATFVDTGPTLVLRPWAGFLRVSQRLIFLGLRLSPAQIAPAVAELILFTARRPPGRVRRELSPSGCDPVAGLTERACRVSLRDSGDDRDAGIRPEHRVVPVGVPRVPVSGIRARSTCVGDRRARGARRRRHGSDRRSRCCRSWSGDSAGVAPADPGPRPVRPVPGRDVRAHRPPIAGCIGRRELDLGVPPADWVGGPWRALRRCDRLRSRSRGS